MVDAASGALKWNLLPSGGTTTFAGTDSIPSSIGMLDSDGDGLVDRLYTGDTGGNVWRIDMPGSSPGDSSTPWTSFKLASLAGSSSATDYRFFSEPSIARTLITETFQSEYTDADGVKSIVVRTQEKPYDAILLGSGDRSNPLGIDTKDRFFMIKDLFIKTQSMISSDLPDDLKTISATDLYDYTNNPFGKFTLPYSAQEKADLEALQIAVSLKDGWFLDFTRSGEKSSSAAIVINGIAYFTSFTPPSLDPDVVTCELPNGQGWLYAVDLALGTKVYDWATEDPKSDDDRQTFISEQFLGSPTLIVIPKDDGDPDTDDDATGNIIVGRKIIPVGFNLSTLRTYLYIKEEQ
jgi:type IV pilus assembly protein PilY1